MRKEHAITTSRIGIDVGGTFTDLVVVPQGTDGTVQRHKTPSTPHDPSEAVEQGLRDLLEQGLNLSSVDAVVHGTTIGLNAIIQRSGARVSFVTSRGYRDLLGIARARLPKSFDLHAAAELPLVPRERVLEVDARLSADGRLLRNPTESELDQLAEQVRATQPEAVALSLVQGFTAPEVEHELAAALEERLHGVPVISAAGTWPEIREYERSLVAVLEAHIRPLMGRYYERLRARLNALGLTAPVFISASNGGTLSLDYAALHPLETVLSGPASGVTAAALTMPDRNVLTFDMGGTSSDMSVVVGGAPVLTTRTMLGRLPLMLPVVDVSAIGSGGGSMVSAGDTGDAAALHIGPKSAGAHPGPVSYGRGGTTPTITDAYLSAGLLDPQGFLGGTMPLDRSAADSAFDAIAQDAGLGAAGAAAEYVLEIATVQMATALRTILAERGHEPSEFTLVPFGGAGPTHALLLADELGIEKVLVPASAATFCALGAAIAPLRRDLARSIRRTLNGQVRELAADIVTELAAEGIEWLRSSGGAPERAHLGLSADMRYQGQAYELTVALATRPLDRADELVPDLSTLREAFHAEHERVHGFRDENAAVELGTLRLATLSPATEAPHAAAVPTTGTESPPPTAHRDLRERGRWVRASIYAAAALPGHATVTGPAVIDVSDSTVLVPTGWTAASGIDGTIHLTRQHHPTQEDRA
ncbi:hydantoinase/oxoprolinase family protein [Brachybacterium sacelli]|uniref:N-methylhydantoinase A n=1 Tax=Brachybacterium sacelli TaxID=173364 RepID=A0ABS4X2Y4_9MICO|nr:N-methylhydantoinase A [Brachybacterium sacelli]